MSEALTTIRHALDDVIMLMFAAVALGAVWRDYIPKRSRLWWLARPAVALCSVSLLLRVWAWLA